MSNITERDYKNALKDGFDFDDFKSVDQKRAIECIMTGEKNILISLATQAGKSLCYQLISSFQRDGIILVIAPSISLITNQIAYLTEMRIPATSITSVAPLSNREEKIKEFYDYKNVPYKFLFITPEMLIRGSYKVRDLIEFLLEENQISHIAVDEAHMIVDYNNNFRDSFKELGQVRKKYSEIPWIALTTASNVILNKIARILCMIRPQIIRGPSTRKNIFYDVMQSRNESFVDFKSIIKDMIELNEEEEFFTTRKVYASGIIYCKTNHNADHIAHNLCENGITSESFYGAKRDVNDIQKRWKEGQFPVLVATEESFGLGIKRNPLQFVLHMSMPKNLRAFYQQSGRIDVENGYSRIYVNKFYNGDVSPEMLAFINIKDCRHKHIAEYFGDEILENCGNKCDNCVKNQ
ncbi:hypothetical protein PVAND_005312 [Polypedilum vanderplanki]|uniref:ATP-dependent DNA helicase n=1 Tax=Polypedilum vanderplanki TaxID=319348 RepID=A0A9J6BZS8_POLVA|nr:hypothetical protein PVAND_005312 [Polypedilum vanderplanki]